MLNKTVYLNGTFYIADCQISPSVHINTFSIKIRLRAKGFRWWRNHHYQCFLPMAPFRFLLQFYCSSESHCVPAQLILSALVCIALLWII